MKALSLVLLIGVVIIGSGCLMPNMKRLIPENKSAHVEVFSPLYGYIVIDTRVPGDTNALPELQVGKSINIK